MSDTTKDRPGVGTEAAETSLAGDIATVPAGPDTIPAPRHRIGCLNGCRGYGHDPDCPVSRPMPVGTTCSLDRRCSTVGIEVLASDAYVTCPCVEALAAHAGVTR